MQIISKLTAPEHFVITRESVFETNARCLLIITRVLIASAPASTELPSPTQHPLWTSSMYVIRHHPIFAHNKSLVWEGDGCVGKSQNPRDAISYVGEVLRTVHMGARNTHPPGRGSFSSCRHLQPVRRINQVEAPCSFFFAKQRTHEHSRA